MHAVHVVKSYMYKNLAKCVVGGGKRAHHSIMVVLWSVRMGWVC
jgi:hypothetical protein